MNGLQYQKGFTLVEVLISLFILSVAISGIMFILVTNSNSATAIKNNYIASGLAQEGIEVVRNIRDSDWHAGSAFGTSLPAGQYRVQWDSTGLLPIGSQPALRFDSTAGLYGYDAGTDSLFRRSIDISSVSSEELKVVVTVQWTERGIPKSVTAENHLYDWKI